MSAHPTPQALAEATAQAMFSTDAASQHMGMHIANIGPGCATLQMTVLPWMVNGHAICHGGFIFTLADSAFAFACNSYNHATVAGGCSIEFLAPGKLGDTLIAEAREVWRAGRNGVYDITVRNGEGITVAVFRGKSRQIKGSVIPEAAH